MGSIIALPDHIISQIAAGEVIERPCYAVKELVENALDAKANHLTIEIEQSGLGKIAVFDNGTGMAEDDLQICCRPHTTSKLSIEEGLSKIQSFGFRGEALSSIAAISTLAIASRRKEDAVGKRARFSGTTLKDITPIGMPFGTSVTITNLFATIPARKKFLKSERTEFRHILDICTQSALAHPDTRFQLYHNKKLVVDLLPNQPLINRIKILLGNDIAARALPVSYQDSYLHITGFIAKPDIASSLPNKQFTFVNGRYVTDVLVATAAKEAFGTLLASRSYPVFLLFITLPHDLIDVNVHPRKQHIKFIENRSIFEAVKQAVSDTLATNNIAFFSTGLFGFDAYNEANESKNYAPRDTESFAGRLLKQDVMPQGVDTPQAMQLHNCYLVFPTQDGMVMIDQHAAHERVLYEKFVAAYTARLKAHESIPLPKPHMLSLTLAESEILQEHIEVFTSLGFTIEPFGGTDYTITHIPLLFTGRKISSVILETLAELGEHQSAKAIDTKSHKMLSFLACRSAIMAGEPLSQPQALELLTALEKTAQPATCPHGRPTRIAMTIAELDTLFRR